ncbi:hypothetical protein BST61_g549 [Cercospora zeina]
MSSIVRLLNTLLPFATPGTPVYRDVIHLGVLAVLLYFAPRIQEHYQRRNNAHPGRENHLRDEDSDQDRGNQQHGHIQPPVHDHDNNTNNVHRPAHRNLQPNAAAANEPPIEAAGPAAAAQPAALMPAAQRNIGAKKAKSLAKKDHKRAYHEFQRSQGDARRAKDAEGAAEREAAQAAAFARRKATEAKLAEKKAKEREQRRARERREREERISWRERAVERVKEALQERRMCHLFDVGREIGGAGGRGDWDEVALEKMLNAAGVVGTSPDGATVTMVTSTGWVVRVREEDMRRAYEIAARSGEEEMDWEGFGEILRKTLLEGDG